MEIKEKLIFKIGLKKEIDRYIKEFPIYFYGNILVNISLIILCLILLFFACVSMGFDLRASGYLIAVILFFGSIMRITFKGFLRNLNILHEIGKGKYTFGIEDHEMDMVVEFLEDLPMKKEDVEQMKVALSFDKLIDVLEAADIINYENGVYNMNIIFKYRTKGIFGKGFF